VQILFMSVPEIHNNQVCNPDEHGLIAQGQAIASKLGKGRESEASQDTDLAALVLTLVAQRLAAFEMLKQGPLLSQQGSQQDLRIGAAKM